MEPRYCGEAISMKFSIFNFQFSNLQRGQAALTTVVLLLFVSLIMGSGISAIALKESRISKINTRAKESYMIAESGAEDMLYRIKNNMEYDMTETLILNDITATTSVSDIGTNEKKIIAQGDSAEAIRTVDIHLKAGAGASFFYGAQAGEGGLEMDDNSRVEGAGGTAGNVYVNGPVEGDSGATITGTLISAQSIDDIIVQGDAYAASIEEDAKICGNAFAPTIDNDALTFLNNPKKSSCPEPLTPGSFTITATPDTIPMPISAEQIQQWKNDAGCGSQPPDPFCLYEDDYNLAQNASLGPLTITGNLLMKNNNKTLTVTGTLYVKGAIDIDNGSAIKCDASYADANCIVIADSWIHTKNNGTFAGSGIPGSYLMLLSTLACNGSSAAPPCDTAHHNGAIDLHNNAAGALFYASDGMINLHNNVTVTALTGYKLRLDNNATVIYEAGLSSAWFSSGPAGGWEIADWREVK